MTRVTLKLTATFEQVDEGWVQARIVEIPGVITVAPTREEAEELLADALREYLVAVATPEPRKESDGESIPVEIVIG